MASTQSPTPEPPAENLELRVEFELGIPEDTDCPLFTRFDGNAKRLALDNHDGLCYIEVETEAHSDEESGIVRFKQPVGNCSCPAFWKHDCFPRAQAIDEGTAIIETYVADRETLRALVADIRETGRSVRIRKLTAIDETENPTEFRLFDVGTFSKMEREMLEYAVEMGYYDADRKVSLGDIAETFGVTKQCCSDRLGSAEAKMALDLFR